MEVCGGKGVEHTRVMEWYKQEGPRQGVDIPMLSGLNDRVGPLTDSGDLLEHAASGVNHKHHWWWLPHAEQPKVTEKRSQQLPQLRQGRFILHKFCSICLFQLHLFYLISFCSAGIMSNSTEESEFSGD